MEFKIRRKLLAPLMMDDLVSVQPISMPSGLLFYLDYLYAKTKNGAVDDIVADAAAPEEAVTPAPRVNYLGRSHEE